MDKTPNKSQFLKRIRQSRAKLDTLLASIDPSKMTQPGVGDWSVKDILAHITWHDQEMLNVINSHALVSSSLWGLPLDQRNAAIFKENEDRPLKEVLKNYYSIFAALLEAMHSLSEADLRDPGRFPNMPSDWKPWEMFASNTYEHYEDHLAGLKAWRKKLRQD